MPPTPPSYHLTIPSYYTIFPSLTKPMPIPTYGGNQEEQEKQGSPGKPGKAKIRRQAPSTATTTRDLHFQNRTAA